MLIYIQFERLLASLLRQLHVIFKKPETLEIIIRTCCHSEMGVRGLTTYIAKHADQYLQPYELHDCYIVIDGNNIASQLYNWVSKCNCAFGGDYDIYNETVVKFFKIFKKCNVLPLVLFDGGYETRKLCTVKTRLKTRIYTAKNVNPVSQSRIKVFPLLMREAFKDALLNLKVPFLQCDFEADEEIASLARTLGCPVLSYDSDFYIYDVLYIPFSTLEMETSRVTDASNECYVKCKIYTIKNFLQTFGGLDMTLLPLIATLLGNDYIKPCIFNNFYSQIKLPKNRAMNETQKKISGLLHWLQTETLETAIKKVLGHMKKKDHDFVAEQINRSIKSYSLKNSAACSVFGVSASVDGMVTKESDLLHSESSKGHDSKISEHNISFLPKWFRDNFTQGHLHSCFLDMLIHNTYFMTPQVEDFSLPFSHDISLPIVKIIFDILITNDSNNKRNVLTYYSHGSHGELKPSCLISQEFYSVTLNSLPLLSVSERTSILYESLGFSLDRTIIEQFPEDWKIFILSVLYWFRNMKEPASNFSYLNAVILCAIVLKIIDVNCGYCRTTRTLRKQEDILIRTLRKREIDSDVNDSTMRENSSKIDTNSIKNVLDTICVKDCFAVAEALLPFHKMDERLKSNVKLYSKTAVHAFAQLQSCIFHYRQLNSLLNFPLPQIQISQFFSGTLIYNLYTSFQKRVNVTDYVSLLLCNGKSILNFHNSVIKILISVLPSVPVLHRKRHKKRRKKKERDTIEDSIDSCSFNETDIFDDINNRFYALSSHQSV